MLEIQDLHVKFHNRTREAVAGISLTIPDGEILGLVGESGSGKSVTAMSVAGLLPPTTSALLHNMSTLGISLKSMTDLGPELPSPTPAER